MTPDCGPTPLTLHTRSLRLAAELIEKTDAGLDQLRTLLTAEPGPTESEIIYEENKLELHRYTPDEATHETPIFVVYALVNRPYILDLQPDRSVIRRLLEAGFVVYLVDWGEPSRLDSALDLEDYVCRYLDNCVDAVCADAGVADVHLLGYCMGGSMSIMYTVLNQARVRTLALMATPVAFDGDAGILERWAVHADVETAVETFGNIPAELLAFQFSMMDPIDQYVGKYVRLYENIENESFVANFSRMEQWIWDGVDVPGAAYREFVGDLYKENELARNEFALGGERIDLSTIETPVLQIVGEYDHIVPPESSKPFNAKVGSEDTTLIEFPAGHIGISVSSRAQRELWPEVADWFADRGTDRGTRRDLEQLRGIGPTYAERLAGAGIETTADLGEYEPRELADIADTSPARTEAWLAQLTTP